MSRSPQSQVNQASVRRSPGHREKTFDKSAIARMFAARDDGVSDADIAKRFGVSARVVTGLIGRKSVGE